MSAGMAIFQSELRSAVRDARGGPPARRPAPLPANANAPKGVAIKLWLPLTPLWLLLAPFALLLAPASRLAPMMRHTPTLRGAFALGAVLLALSGTVIEVDAPGARIRIRIF